MSRNIADKAKEYIMKRFTSVLAIIILAFGAWSCKKEESPSQYDANVDAPSTIAQVPADSGILKDQKKISAASGLEGTSPTPSTPTATTTKPLTPESSPSTPTTSPATAPSTPAVKPPAAPSDPIKPVTPTTKPSTPAKPNPGKK
jgi:FtsZ-interacting cell division protein ZipA